MIGYYDIHTHILPELDDGAKNMEEARKMLQMEYKDGVRTIYATTHFRKKMFEPSLEDVLQQYHAIKSEALKVGKDLRILLGCEFHANMDMIETLDEKKRPTMGDTRCVLTEFSQSSDRKYMQERCYELLTHGYQPIIAHAERYPVFYKNLDILVELVEMGVFVQMNAGSIIGAEGFWMKMFCKKAMKRNLLHFVGSDAHNTNDRKPMIGRCAEYMKKSMGDAYMEKILIKNPEKLIEEK